MNMNIPKLKIWVIWQWGAVWVKLGELLMKHSVLKDCVSEITGGLSKLEWEEWREAIVWILEDNDIIVLCVHDDIAKGIVNVRREVNSLTKIIDCSTTHRTNKEWVYGLPELKWRKEQVEEAWLVANPWCHSTAVILSVKPLVGTGLIEWQSVIVQSTTGYSWGWKAMIKEYWEDCSQPAFQYSTWIEHKHIPEMKNQTSLEEVIFQPEVVNYFNGLKTNTFLDLTGTWMWKSEEELIEVFEDYYKWKQFIKIWKVPEDGKIRIDENNGTQNTSLYIKKYRDRLQVIAVIDNMTKWAAGAVIQNLNIMLWLNEEEGLSHKVI